MDDARLLWYTIKSFLRRTMAAPSLRFDEYWPLFVRAHEDPVVRSVHFAATTTGIGCAVVGALGRRLSLILAAPAVVLVPTWLARRLVGPSSSPLPGHTVFRVAASLKMWAMTLAGTMDDEVERLGRAPGPSASDPEEEDHPHPPPNMVTDHTLH